MDIEAFDLRGRKPALYPWVRLEQCTRLFVVPDSVCDGEDGHRLHPGLHAVAKSGLGLSRSPRMVRQFRGGYSLCLQAHQSPLVQDLPPRCTQLSVDHIARQVMGEAIRNQVAHPWTSCFLLSQDATFDDLFQPLDPLPHSYLG